MRIASISRSLVGESPFWSAKEQMLYWSDLRGEAIRSLAHDGCETVTTFGEPVAAPLPLAGGGVAALLASGLFLRDVAGAWVRHARPPGMAESHRFNDATIDPVGRLVGGTMLERGHESGPPGHLYSYDGTRWRSLAAGFQTINGLAFSPDGRRLYVSDSHASVSRVWVADYDPLSGEMGARREFAVLDPEGGRPDGAAVDCEGGYWVAAVGGGRLLRFSADGKIDRAVAMPVRYPTKVAFGGADLSTIYVSSMIAPDPAARSDADGALFCFAAPFPGSPVPALRLP